MKKSCRTAAVIAAIYSLCSVSVQAQDTPADTIIVTASRTAITADEALASVTTITREDIERSQAKTVVELLTGIAGLDSNVSGGYGKVADFFLRGTNSDHVLVLVDGMRIGSATLGTVSWQFLPLQQIERIEIVRGPRSSLYGADAIGGVIQIFTRKGKEGFHAGVTGGYGTYDSREYTTNISGANGGSHFSFAAGRFQSDGINARKTEVAGEPDADGYRNDSFSARVGHRFAGGTEFEAHLLHAQGHTDYDGSFSNETDFIQNAVGAELRLTPTNMWNTAFRFGRNRDETDDFLNGTYVSTFNTNRRQQSWQNDLTLAPRQLLTLGVDRQTDLVESSSSFNRTSRDNIGYFAQQQSGFGLHELLVSLRREDNQAFGAHDTGNLGWGYALAGERLRLITSYGTAFKAPTFNQLYDPFVGDPDLRPEESESIELSVRGKEKRGRWSVRAYQTNVENLILFQPPTFQAMNVNRARIRGFETEAGTTTTDWGTVALNLTLLDPRNAETDKLLPRRAARSLRFDWHRSIGPLNFGFEWLVQSYRYDDPANTVRMGGYGLVNVHTEYGLGKSWFLRARADNILDKEYETAATYNSLGRRFFVTLGYQTSSMRYGA